MKLSNGSGPAGTAIRHKVKVFQFASNPREQELVIREKLDNGTYRIQGFPCALCGADRNDFLEIAEQSEISNTTDFLWALCRSCGLLQLAQRFDDRSLTLFYQSGDYHRVCMGDLPPSEHFQLYYQVAGPSLMLDLNLLGVEIKKTRFLDIGCGPGAVLKFLKDSGGTVRGFDLDPNIIEFGRKFVEEIEVGDALSWDSPLQDFDLILMGCVLPHLANPVEFLKSLHDRMNFSQKVVLTLPNLDQCNEYSSGPFTEFLHIGHIHYFNAITIERCANSAGFVVEKIVPRGAAMAVLLTKTTVAPTNSNNAFLGSLTSIQFSDFSYRGVDRPIRKALRKFYRSPKRLIRSFVNKVRQSANTSK